MESFIEEKEDCACYAGQPTNNAEHEFVQAFKDMFEKLVEQKKEWLLENRSSDYVCGSWHYSGTYANSPEYYEYDEEKSFEDAKEQVIAGLVNVDEEIIFDLFDNIEFSNKLGQFLKGL